VTTTAYFIQAWQKPSKRSSLFFNAMHGNCELLTAINFLLPNILVVSLKDVGITTLENNLEYLIQDRGMSPPDEQVEEKQKVLVERCLTQSQFSAVTSEDVKVKLDELRKKKLIAAAV